MKWLDKAQKSRFIRRWRFKKATYLFTEMDPDEPLYTGIYFMDTGQYFFQSQN